MTKEEVQMLGFEIVSYAGDARSKLLIALDHATKGNFEDVDALLKEASELLNHAHTQQMDMLAEEARGTDLPYSFTMIHGQDHLMTAMLLQDTMKVLIELMKRTSMNT